MKQKIELTNKQLKKLQCIELEMLIEIDRICRKYNIRYSLDGGTLLGAVRHKGFIPWDNDIDVIMRRSEYVKFSDACKKELDFNRFFLQDYMTDKNYIFGYAKLRHNGTKFVRVGQEHLKQHCGIFVDIFIVDNVPDNAVLREIHYWASFVIRKGLYSEIGRKSAPNAFLKTFYEFLSFVPKNMWFFAMNALAKVMENKNTELISHITHYYPKHCKYGLPSRCFDEFTELEFESRVFMAFKEYDLYLSTYYGNYMILPPVEKRVTDIEICEIEFPK